MIRPQPRFFMPGTAARMAWKADDRLMAMIAFHLSIGNSSIGETNWMPALLTSTSTEPKLFSPSATISAISGGLLISAGEYAALTLKSVSMRERSFSMSAGVPKPLMTTLAPAPAKPRAIANPVPRGEPVTTAVLPDKIPMWLLLLFGFSDFAAVPRKVVCHHGFAGLRPFQPFLVLHRPVNVTHACLPVFDHGDMGKVVILGRGFVVLALVDQMHHGNRVLLGGLA